VTDFTGFLFVDIGGVGILEGGFNVKPVDINIG
jgi:hypothetical protein